MAALAIPTTTPALTRLQRASGEGRLSARADGGETRLVGLYQEGCAQIRLPRAADQPGLGAVLINTAGGLTGGDRLSWRLEAGADTHVTATTQACEKVYRARDGVAEVATSLTVGARARLDWLPQESILFDRAQLRRRLEADVAAEGRLLAVEAVLMGRQAMGETLVAGAFQDRWRVRREGRLIFADELKLAGRIADLAARPAVLGGAIAFAQVLLVAPDAEDDLPQVRAHLTDTGGASAWDGKLFCRIAAADGLALRRILIPVLAVLRGGAALPRAWSL